MKSKSNFKQMYLVDDKFIKPHTIPLPSTSTIPQLILPRPTTTHATPTSHTNLPTTLCPTSNKVKLEQPPSVTTQTATPTINKGVQTHLPTSEIAVQSVVPTSEMGVQSHIHNSEMGVQSVVPTSEMGVQSHIPRGEMGVQSIIPTTETGVQSSHMGVHQIGTQTLGAQMCTACTQTPTVQSMPSFQQSYQPVSAPLLPPLSYQSLTPNNLQLALPPPTSYNPQLALPAPATSNQLALPAPQPPSHHTIVPTPYNPQLTLPAPATSNQLALPAPATSNQFTLPAPQPTPTLPPPTALQTYNPRQHVLAPQPMDIDQKIIYTCTLCQTDFNTRITLERHNRNMHDAYSQTEKGVKRKNQFKTPPRKRTSKTLF
jgi:hypothetical protein